MTNTKVLIDAARKLLDQLPKEGEARRWHHAQQEIRGLEAALASYAAPQDEFAFLEGEREKIPEPVKKMVKEAMDQLEADAAPPDTGDRNPYRLDWPKHFPIMSNIRDRTGIAIEWQMVWSEVEGWYGDIKKKETGEVFLKRLQSQFLLTERKPEGQVTSKSAGVEREALTTILQLRGGAVEEFRRHDYRALYELYNQIAEIAEKALQGEAGKQPEQQPAAQSDVSGEQRTRILSLIADIEKRIPIHLNPYNLGDSGETVKLLTELFREIREQKGGSHD